MNNDKIAYFDIEVIENSGTIDRLGLLIDNTKEATTSISDIIDIFKQKQPKFICGHNFIKHDKFFLSQTSLNPIFNEIPVIDTLYLSMLLFVNKKTHKLSKPYKIELNIENQPLGDAEQTRELFLLLNTKFDSLDKELQNIFSFLLYKSKFFNGFFSYKALKIKDINIYNILKDKIFCSQNEFEEIENNYPEELAFIISYLYSDNKASISSVILFYYPKIVSILKLITFTKNKINLEEFAINEFNISSFRKFEKETTDLFNTGNISQKDIIINSLDNTSLLVILPTGGGKTFTFQLPALIKAQSYKGLTVVVSPLQALMKNHVDSFKEKNQNFRVVAISGYLTPIERMNIITEVENGVVDILYLAPEALRSNSIFKALKKRIIERFVIDEAHCFSSWGHDFRHDYYFIANTIKELENESKFQSKIPVSCFTATAKPEVLNDIKKYFFDKLNIELKEFIASSKRYNLKYRAIEVLTKKDKYELLIKELTKNGKKPTIIYIPQNAKECKELSKTLNNDERLFEFDLVIEPFYSKIDDEIENKKRKGRNKSEILNDFINNKIDIVIATTAFGMGIDKSDIQTVIHYEQSDSLESYLQESGRGARDENLEAQCIVLYSKNDFNKTFAQLNHSKVDLHEIQRIVKELKKYKKIELNISPKDLAKKMGIDTEDSKIDYESIIKTALLELEQCDIIQRGRNGYKIFATSINNDKSMDTVHEVLDAKKDEYKEIYSYMILLMQNIIQRSKIDAIEVDDLSDIVGIERKIIFNVLYALQKEKFLEFNNDISIYIKKSVQKDFLKHFELENKIFEYINDLKYDNRNLNLRDLNNLIPSSNKNNINLFKKIIQSWTHLSKLKAHIFQATFNKDICSFELLENNKDILKNLINIRKKTCKFIIDKILEELGTKDELEVEISTNKLKFDFEEHYKLSLEGFHHSLVYLNELLNSFKLMRGRLIYYQTFQIDKKDNINQITPYKNKDYKKSLKPYYERKIESVHIQISFLERLLKDGWNKTSRFVQDYFGMDYNTFKKQYKFNDKHIKLPVTQERLKEIIEDLNEEQQKIFKDKSSKSIMVLAGPGSGKTKILVHKIASLITIENNKPEYFLMLAHSRVAVAEFRERLKKLIGNQIYDIKIFTFHAFAISLLGKNIDDNNNLHNVISKATNMIYNEDIELPFINMLVLDEYQDVSYSTYEFIKAIYSKMGKDKKIIAVGDDDQCINNFGKDQADMKYINQFKNDFGDFEKDDDEDKTNIFQYNLLNNYRSKNNIVDFLNKFNEIIPNRLKTTPLISHSKENGKINLITYNRNNSYFMNIFRHVINNKSNNIAIIARNNDEVLTLYSMLIEHNIKSKYIASTDGFSLGNLIELVDFLYYWKNSTNFNDAREQFHKQYKQSKNYNLANVVISKFEEEYDDKIINSQKHFITIFEQYLREITFDEFEYTKSKVTVSTMHKAKGKEWNDVYICVKDNVIKNDYDKRLLYVAISRAKNNLYIHTKDNIFNFLSDYCSENYFYGNIDIEPSRIVFMMTLKDIALSDKISSVGIHNTKPNSGEVAYIKNNKDSKLCIYKNNQQICKLSNINLNNQNILSTKIYQKQQEGYMLEQKVEIEYIVSWKDSENTIFYQVLSKVYMIKSS